MGGGALPQGHRRRQGAAFLPHYSHGAEAAGLLEGGSLYWVIKGQLSARQKLLDIEEFTDADGIGRCKLILGPEVIETMPQPKRPFQGWRYLEAKDAPADLFGEGQAADMPAELKRELAELGLL